MRHSLLTAALVAGTLLAAAPANAAPSPDIVISEVYGGGGSPGAPYQNDFVELFNRGTTDAPLSGKSIQYASATGTGNFSGNSPVALSGSIEAGQRVLIQLAGGAAGAPLPEADTTATSPNLSGTAGKVALVDQAAGLQCNGSSDPCSAAEQALIRDLVGYGNANYSEGAAAPAASVTTSVRRGGSPEGCQDTDVNAADFTAGAPGPQNRGVQPTPCGGPPADARPAVADSDPADGDGDVARDGNVTVTFTEPVTAAANAFSLTCGATPVTLAVSRATASTYVLDPQGSLPEGARCTLAVEGDNYSDDDTTDPPDTGADYSATFTTVGATGLRIHDIQAARHLSPHEDEIVSRVPGVVTAVRSTGFYMQDDQPDDDEATSEGILVFTGSRPTLAPGDRVEVSGNVNEFRGGCEPTPCQPGDSAFDNLTITELDRATVYPGGKTDPIEPHLVGEGGDEPPLRVYEDDALGNVEIGNVLFDPEEDGLDWHESHEGMLVEISNPEVVGLRPSFGELPVVSRGAAELRTPRGGIVIREGDMNPERFILDDVIGSTPVAQVGDSLGESIVAIADYGFGDYLYYPTGDPQVTPGNLQREVTDPKRANQLALASMNVENLDGLDPQDKFDELASIVVDNLRSPDILAVEEMQDNDGAASSAPTDASLTYKRFIDAIAAAGGPRYEFRQIDPEPLSDGGEAPGNIRVGFLFRTDTGVEFVDRPGATARTPNEVVPTRKGVALKYSPGRIDPTNEAFTSSRKPLAAEFLWKGRTVFAIANHFNSKGGDDPLGGRFQPPVESSTVQRHKQANVVAGFVEDILAADPRAAVAVLGDLNDFQFSETLEILEDAGLANLMETLPENEQYSYVFDGNSQVLDQILVSKELLTPKPEYDSVHVNAEFADQASDHDPQIARVVVRGTNNAK